LPPPPTFKTVAPPLQEAQLSHRDGAIFHVIEYFAKSLKVTHGDSK